MCRYSIYWPPKSGRGPVFLTILGNASFIDNIAGDNGGAIYASGAREYRTYDGSFISTIAHVDLGGSVVFYNNSALGSYGGAISIEGQGKLAIRGDVRLQGNVGLTQGGAIHVIQECEANISDRVSLDSNYAPSGGALYISGSAVRLSGAVSISNNYGQIAGGGIMAEARSTITLLDDVAVIGSSASMGGAIYAASSSLVIAGRTRLADNHAEIGGMACLVNSLPSTITGNTRIENNQADSDGAGVFVFSTSLVVGGAAILAGNKAGASGGAIAARASATVLVTGTASLLGNTGRSFGGAIDVDATAAAWLDGRSSLKLNRAATGGGLSLRQAADPLAVCP